MMVWGWIRVGFSKEIDHLLTRVAEITGRGKCKMGIFEDEERKMAKEAAQRIRSDQQRKTELSQVAVSVKTC
jgi:hypothetical protein